MSGLHPGLRRGLILSALLAVALLLLARVWMESDDESTTIGVQPQQTGHGAASATYSVPAPSPARP